MKEVLNELSKVQIEFICKECSITEEKLNEMDEEQIYDIVFETMCDIEIDEVCSRSAEEEDSERCEIASDIVTAFSRALAVADGFFDRQDEEAEE